MATIKKNNNFFFPSNPNIKRYYYPSTNTIFTTTSTQSIITSRIMYMPIYISRYIENPNFCIEITGITGSFTFQVGIYSSKNGIINAPLLWKGNIVSSSAGIAKVTSNIKLKEDWYILASTITSVGTSASFRVTGVNMFRVLFGESDSLSTITGGQSSNYYFEDIAGGLANNIGTPSTATAATTPMIALEY